MVACLRLAVEAFGRSPAATGSRTAVDETTVPLGTVQTAIDFTTFRTCLAGQPAAAESDDIRLPWEDVASNVERVSELQMATGIPFAVETLCPPPSAATGQWPAVDETTVPLGTV